MKTFSRSSFVSCLLGCVLGLSAQAGTITENFSSTNNFLTNGVKGTIWDGVYLGAAGEYTRTGAGGGAGPVASVATTTNGVLAVVSAQTDWENAADDGFLLYKVVSGDFDMSVQVLLPFDNGNWNTFGLMARAFGPGGNPIQPTNSVVTENYVTWARFANQNYNYIDNIRNGAEQETSRPSTNYFLRMERIGNDLNVYDKALVGDVWILQGTITRPDFAGAPLQVGIMQATFDTGANPGTQRTARFDDFSLTAASVGGTAPSAATSLLVTTNAQNDLNLAWTGGAGSDGAVVVVWTGTNTIKQTPADGIEYTTKPYGLGDALPFSSYYVVFSGSAPSTTVSNLAGQIYNFAVYSYAGSGTARTYNRTPATARVASPAQVTSLVLAAPASAVAGSARNMKVTAFYNNGATFDVTATAAYTSSASNVVTIQAAGRLAALTNGNANIVATFSGSSSTQAVSVASMARTRRWRFNEPAGSTTFVDSDGGANGTLQNSSGFSGATGSEVTLSGPAGDSAYVQLPPNLVSNYGAITVEAWARDDGAVAGARIASFANDATHYTVLSSLSGGGPRGSINNGALAQNLTGANVPAGAEHHYVFTVQGSTRTARLYVDGLLVAQNTAYPFVPEDAGPTANDWIGRSEAGTLYYAGGISELRIYNGALDQLAVAVNAVAGPDTLISDPGALQSLALTLNPSTVTEGDVQTVNTIGNFANVTRVDVTTVVSYSSSATNIASISAAGVVTAWRAGSATISAFLSGVTNTAVLTVLAKPTGLRHRFSFNEPAGTTVAGDSIAPGIGDGTLFGTAVITNGQVVLDGVNANAAYVALGPDLMSGFNSVTVEGWFTDDNAGTWNRVWDLGTGTANGVWLTVNPANTLNARAVIRRLDVEQAVNFRRPAYGKEHHVAYSQDFASGTSSIYVDGVLVATNISTTFRPRDMGAAANMWLGRSAFAADNFFKGSINEFRIWEGALTPTQVALNYGLGPNTVPTVANPGAVSTVSVTVSPAAAGQVQQTKAIVNFASVANVNMTPFASNWVSSDSTVAKVDQTGMVTTVGAGNASISATFSGVTGNGALTVSAAPAPALAHRYSFTSSATDSIGGANGTLTPGATINNGAVVLTGAADSQVNLPGHLFDGFGAVTIETWATFTNSTPNNASLWGFGNPSDAVRTWLAFIPQGNAAGDTRIRYFLNQTNSAAAGEVTLAKRGRPVGAGTGTNNVHYAVVVNPPLGQAELYINGMFQESFSWTRPDRGNILPIDLSRLSNEQGFLGHTVQTNGTPASNAVTTIDEFRIWNGALNKAQVAASFAAGPNSPVIDPGAPSALTLKVSDTTAVQGTTQRPTVWGTFAGGTLDLTGITGVGLSSDNSAIVLVDGNRLRAVGTGTANITARYGGRTDTKPVTVVTKQFVMTHRYSFTADASDSVGHADGTLWGSASISNGAVVLNASTAPLTFVDLPADLISGYGTVTLEMFGTVTANAANTRLFDFGDSANGTGVGYLSLDPNGSRVFTLAPKPVRTGTLGGAGVAEQSATTTARSGTFHVVAVVDETNPSAKTIRYYTNGVLAVAATNDLVNLSTINNTWSFLGRSMFVGDPLFNGTINEFRVYHGAMAAADVAASFTAGPDATGSAVPTLNFARSGNNIVLSWSDASAALVAAGSLTETFTNVPGATSPYTNAPILQQLFFRLKK